MGTNFLQVVEEIEETLLAAVSGFIVYACVGKTSKQLLGIIVRPIAGGGKERRIYFHDIDRMIAILEDMK